MMKVSKIEIGFPVHVEIPQGFEKALYGLINEVCKKYKRENKGRAMWARKPEWIEPEDPPWDDLIYRIGVVEREDYK